MPSRRSHTAQVLLAAASLMALGIAISTTDLRERLAAGVGELDRANPALLVGAVFAFAFALLCCGLAWHAGLRAAGVSISRQDAMSRYVAGSLVNSLVPLRAGGAVRLALYVRAAGSVRTVSGVAVAIGSVRSAWLAALVATASTSAPIPRWPVAALAGATIVAGIVAVALVRTPIRLGSVAAWVCGATIARLTAATVVAAAFDAPHPFVAGIAMVAAIELAGTLPLTPGNVGLSSAAVALVLAAHGLTANAALAAGISLAAVETTTSVALGLAGVAHLTGSRLPRLRRRGGQRPPVPAVAETG